ncbi:hypothetical protein F7R15_27725 [Pseudomonas reinekei]|uniref:Uncharacterized protein n=1 Tax=Pseudomonas reinekei TaxID=395598 RepID=A0A6H9R4S9_PSERE|nr:hypothetical protein F7R15_27725 [Pseudomonas reinekei]
MQCGSKCWRRTVGENCGVNLDETAWTYEFHQRKWKGLSKSVNAEDVKGYHAGESRMMTNLP